MATAAQPRFGDLLRRWRTAAGLTQEELAARASLSAHGIADLETGRRHTPRKDTVALLAEALGLTGRDRATFEAAARQKPGAAGTGAAPGAGVVGVRLVGREAEVELIERHLAGQIPPLLLFAGEPGIGKSRLMREAVNRAAAQGWETLWGGCHRRSGQEPFTPLLTALERRLSQQSPAQQRQSLQGCSWLARLLPELAETGIVNAPNATLPPEHERRLMFAAVARYLANVAGPAGVLLALDDLQWAATDALDLLGALLRAPMSTPLRIVAAYRTTEARKQDPLAILIADLAREDLASRVALEPLNMLDARTLLDELLPNELANDGATFKQQLIVRTGGVPYFLISCAQAIASGVIGGPTAASSVPWNVAETIRQRVGALSVEAQAALDVAAIVGRDAPRTLLLRTLASAYQSEAVTLAALDAACGARLLTEDGDRSYHFAHDLVREVVSADLTTGRRAALHRQVAEALEQEPGEAPVERLAYHYAQSELVEKAALYLELAGDRARAQYAHAEAADYYRRLVERLDALGRSADAARAREKLGAVLVMTAQFDEAQSALAAAVAVHQRAQDTERLLATAAQIGWIYSLRGDPGQGIAYLAPFVEGPASAQPASRGSAAIFVALAHLSYLGGQYREQLLVAERAVAAARAADDTLLLCQAAFEHGTALLYHGRFSEALAVLEDAIPLAEESGDLWTLCWLLSSASTIHHFRGQWDSEQCEIDRALELATRLGDPPMLTLMTFRIAIIAQARGEWDVALERANRCMSIQDGAQTSWITPYPLFLLGELLLAKGQPDEAIRRLEESIELASRSGDLSPQRFAHTTLAEYDLLLGRPQAAQARLEPLLDRPGQQEGQVMSMLPCLAWACLELGDETQTVALLDQASERSAAMGGYFTQVDALRVRGMLLMRQRRWDEAMAAFDESLRLARAMPYPYGEAKTLYTYGLFHLQRREPEPARARLASALTLLNHLGERLYAERVEQAMRVGAPATPSR